MSDRIPIPVPNFDNAGFWDGCRQHELRIQQCRGCGIVRHPPRPMCPQCNRLEYEWIKASGLATVYSFTIVHGPTLPVFQARAPHNVAVVQLDEGPFLVTNIVDCAADQLRIGVRVAVVFEDVSAEVTLPRFRPADSVS
ncbi:MAG TPA: Zn-ribbon domain-containing OB-fold protein [Candidatus Binatia bacterium]|nr:Zn-ribbon domain-containing OB-fold protein [Candidatus Binatia bacterium]